MERRKFLNAAALLGISVAANSPAKLLAADKGKTVGSAKYINSTEEELINVACAISKGTTEIDYIGPCAAFETWLYDDALKKYKPHFKIYTVSETLEAVDNRIAEYTFETAPVPQIVLVPAQQGSDALLKWLQKMNGNVELIMSVCVGARHLAKAGLLNGLRATTHHESIDQFAKDYPEVNWVKGVRFIEEKNICTGGGLTAGIDLGLRIVERYLGRASAQKVADHLEYTSTGWIVN
ncbi:MAG: DJ-1/PfpI family protein [Chitinophagales bacterium]